MLAMRASSHRVQDVKTNQLLTRSEIREGYSVRPRSQYDYVRNAQGGYDTVTFWYARLWAPWNGWMGNVYFDARKFATREECQSAIDAAGGAGDTTAISWGASGYREDFQSGQYIRA
jgi:hypothetical protein